ncbi:MAG: hypothetical protein HY402_03175 [Elusimicrobia bacterium]|nr:hypothetical protein [Elusimicrobiota bacterium]
MLHRQRLLNLCLVWAFSGFGMAYAKIGLGTQFFDAVIENLEIGGVYNLRELRGIPYQVKNSGDAEAEVLVEVLQPEEKELKPEYEPIPDPSWIQILPERHRMPPHSKAFSDLVITIPEDPGLAGRHFQAVLWAHTVDTGLFGAGVRSRVRFSVGAGPETLKEERRRKAMVKLNFDIWPQTLYLSRVEAGEKYDVKKKEAKSLKVTNRSDELAEFVLESVAWEKALAETLVPGYEAAADPGWLELQPKRFKVKPNSVREVKLFLRIPEEMGEKKIGFLIEARLPIGTVVSRSHRVFVNVLGGSKE